MAAWTLGYGRAAHWLRRFSAGADELALLEKPGDRLLRDAGLERGDAELRLGAGYAAARLLKRLRATCPERR